ncbi:MAG: DUF188 domain-containing protein [Spirochaetia bacterium]|nr:DUF188 domain-containing protein [Spirochaetia bacterium]
MRFFIDSDSCPPDIREIVARAGLRTKHDVVFVANRKIPHSRNPYVSDVIVESGKDRADDYIVENSDPSDIVITRDILLAERLVNRNVAVVNDRGTLYTSENIRERVSLRNYMQELSDCGLKPVSTAKFSKREIFEFANAFDRLLTSKLREK